MYKDIINSAPRGIYYYKIGEHQVTLREMSVSQQFKWEDIRKANENDLENLYCHLIKMCCDEFAGAEINEISELAPSHIINMGNKIIELGASGKKE